MALSKLAGHPRVIIDEEAVRQFLRHNHVLEELGPDIKQQQESIDLLKHQIVDLQTQLKTYKSKKTVCLRTTLAAVGSFLGTYGVHALSVLLHMGFGAAAVSVALFSPVGWICAGAMALVAGGFTLGFIIYERRQLTSLIESLQLKLEEYTTQMNAKMEHIQVSLQKQIDAQQTQFEQFMQQTERRMDNIVAKKESEMKMQTERFEEVLNQNDAEFRSREARMIRCISARDQLLRQTNEDYLERYRQQELRFVREREHIKNTVAQEHQQAALQKLEEQNDTFLEHLRQQELRFQPVRQQCQTMRNTLEEMEEAVFCSICMDAMKDTRLMPCDHLLCRACAERSLARSMVCPICRGSVTDFAHLYPS